MRLTTIIVLAGITATTSVAAPVMAQERTHLSGAAALKGIAPLLYDHLEEAAIQRAFRSVLNREPTGSELRRYLTLMEENNWTEADVRHQVEDFLSLVAREQDALLGQESGHFPT